MRTCVSQDLVELDTDETGHQRCCGRNRWNDFACLSKMIRKRQRHRNSLSTGNSLRLVLRCLLDAVVACTYKRPT